MLNRMPHHAAFLIELEDENPRELRLVLALELLLRGGLVDAAADDEVLDPVHGIPFRVVLALVDTPCPVAMAGFPARFPFHDQPLVAVAGRDRVVTVVVPHHALREDRELYVPDQRHAAPGYRCGPEGGDVGDPACDCGEVGVGRGEEVEGDLRTEDLAGEGGLEEGWETVVEDPHGLAELECPLIGGFVVVVAARAGSGS